MSTAYKAFKKVEVYQLKMQEERILTVAAEENAKCIVRQIHLPLGSIPYTPQIFFKSIPVLL
jgi:hypothetical protein